MKKKPLTDKVGEVRELTCVDIGSIGTANEVLPSELLKVLPKSEVDHRLEDKPVSQSSNANFFSK